MKSGGDAKKVKEFFNCISEPFFNSFAGEAIASAFARNALPISNSANMTREMSFPLNNYCWLHKC